MIKIKKNTSDKLSALLIGWLRVCLLCQTLLHSACHIPIGYVNVIWFHLATGHYNLPADHISVIYLLCDHLCYIDWIRRVLIGIDISDTCIYVYYMSWCIEIPVHQNSPSNSYITLATRDNL